MILNDKQLRQLCQQEGLVDPYDDALINPASIDLRLGGEVRFPKHEWRTLYAMVGINGKKASHLSPEDSADVWNEILNNMWDEPVQYEMGDWFWVEPGDFILCHSLETVRIPENLSAALYSKSSMGRIGLEHLHCLAGDTLIDAPRDLSVYPHGIPISELAKRGDEFLTYVFDRANMVFTLAPARAFSAKKQTNVVRVDYEWMTGRRWHYGSLTCTPDHRLLTLGGEWVNAEDALGVRLRPLGRSVSRYPYIIPFPLLQNSIREHRFIAKFMYGAEMDGRETHHADGNKLNNDPSNLLVIERGIHQSLHSSGENNPFYGKNHSPETRAWLSAVRQAKPAVFSSETRKKLSIASSGSNNPRYLDISMGTIVSAYQQEGTLEKAAARLGVNTETLARKIKENGYKNTVEWRRSLQGQANHKVTAVTHLAIPQDTYDMVVPGYENFVANGVVVHNSGWGECGFIGQWTWELSNSSPWPIRLQVGKRYMQMVLAEMEAPSASYQLTGRYMNQKGATPAREFGG